MAEASLLAGFIESNFTNLFICVEDFLKNAQGAAVLFNEQGERTKGGFIGQMVDKSFKGKLVSFDRSIPMVL